MEIFKKSSFNLFATALPTFIQCLIFIVAMNSLSNQALERDRYYWLQHIIVEGTIAIALTICLISLIRKNKSVPVNFGFILITIGIIEMLLIETTASNIHMSASNFIESTDELMLSAFGTIVPVFFTGLMLVILKFTPHPEESNIWKSIAGIFLVPFGAFLFVNTLLPLLNESHRGSLSENTLVTFLIFCTIAFAFFIFRTLYILIKKKNLFSKSDGIITKLFLALILPLIGLIANGNEDFITYHFAGNYDNIWFYILTVLNAIALMIPTPKQHKHLLFLFIFQSITFTFTLYFFVVFLTLLPFMLIGIIVFGLGLLLLVPSLLFALHVSILKKNYSTLTEKYSNFQLLIVLLISLAVIPSGITFHFLNSKNEISNAINYVHAIDYEKEYDMPSDDIWDIFNENRNHRFGLGYIKNTPIIDSYFNFLVTDNLTISTDQINRFKEIFLDQKNQIWARENQTSSIAQIDSINTHSTFNIKNGYWESEIDILLSNPHQSGNVSYDSEFHLPDGAFISDYYLRINDEDEHGILAEKKSAIWTYKSIVHRRRDPGILFYENDNKIKFSIFPFAPYEMRYSGLTIIHKEPFTFQIDNFTAQLGDSDNTIPASIKNDQFEYISSLEKQTLPLVKRTAEAQFIVDARYPLSVPFYIERIKAFANQHPEYVRNSSVYFTAASTQKVALAEALKEDFIIPKIKGGYFLGRAASQILYDYSKENKSTFPMIIQISDVDRTAIWDDQLNSWKWAIPEFNAIYSINETFELLKSPLREDFPFHQELVDSTFSFVNARKLKMQNGGFRYLQDNGEPELVVLDSVGVENSNDNISNPWIAAASNMCASRLDVKYPFKKEEHWLASVKLSFKHHVMSPYTSFISLEDESQKQTLLKKQEDVLSGNPHIEIQDANRRMSEPEYILIPVLILLGLWFRFRGPRNVSPTTSHSGTTHVCK